jgi:hypothetical protein
MGAERGLSRREECYYSVKGFEVGRKWLSRFKGRFSDLLKK